MISQQHLASTNRANRDLYAREKVLNSAIIAADISSGWEAYLEIFDALSVQATYLHGFLDYLQWISA